MVCVIVVLRLNYSTDMPTSSMKAEKFPRSNLVSDPFLLADDTDGWRFSSMGSYHQRTSYQRIGEEGTSGISPSIEIYYSSGI